MLNPTPPGTPNPASVIDALIDPAFVEGASRLLAEDPTAVERALRGAIPALLSGIAGHAGTSAGTAGKVSRLMEGSPAAVRQTSNAFADRESAVEQMRTGSQMLRDIFGVRSRRLVEAVAQHAGMPSTSAASLLSLTAPEVVNALRRLNDNPDAPNPLDWLDAQRNAMVSLLPPEISTMTGLSGGLMPSGAIPALPISPTAQDARTQRRKWLVGAGASILVLLLAVGASHGARKRFVASGPAIVSLALPNGTTVEVPAHGFHRSVNDFLAGRGNHDTQKSFPCDRIEFYPGSSRLKPGSLDDVDNLAAILRAYPAVDFRLEGLVSDGSDDVAKRVALDRAHAVGARLQANSVPARRMEADVYIRTSQSDSSQGSLRLVISKRK